MIKFSYVILIPILLIFIGCSSGPIDAKALYKDDCLKCHGKFARKSALGKSQVIANWSKEKIEHAILGYQDETYGRSNKSLMRAQVNSLNSAEVDALAVYISNMNN